MSWEDQSNLFCTEAWFEKFKDYFDDTFHSILAQKSDDFALKELKNKLATKELNRPANVAQYEFCGQLEIYLDKIKVVILQSRDTEKVIKAIQQAEELVKGRKQKIKIANSSKVGWTTIQHMNKADSEDLTNDQWKRVQAAEDAALKDLESHKRARSSSQKSDAFCTKLVRRKLPLSSPCSSHSLRSQTYTCMQRQGNSHISTVALFSILAFTLVQLQTMDHKVLIIQRTGFTTARQE